MKTQNTINDPWFTMSNTEGCTQETLDTINHELEEKIAELDPDDFSYSDEVKQIQKTIFDKYC